MFDKVKKKMLHIFFWGYVGDDETNTRVLFHRHPYNVNNVVPLNRQSVY